MGRQAWVRVKCAAAMVGPGPELWYRGRLASGKVRIPACGSASQIQDVNQFSTESHGAKQLMQAALALLGSLEVVMATDLLRRRWRWGSREGVTSRSCFCLPHNSSHDCKEKTLHGHFIREVISIHRTQEGPMHSMVISPST